MIKALHKITLLLASFVMLATTQLKAQTYNDGCMNIQMAVGYSWVESVDDPITGELNDNEFRFRWWGADNADLDGQGFVGGTTIGVNSGGYGWVTGQDVTLLNNTYGTVGTTPYPVPQYLQLQGEGWEDDCFDCYRSTGTFTWACDQCSSYSYDGGCSCSTNILCGCSAEDQHCGPYVISNSINYRVLPPCMGLFSPPTTGNGWVGDFYGNACGSDDIGAEVLATWTPPIPDPIVSTANILCQPGLVTLSTGGAVFGGDYHWYNNGNGLLVGTGSQITPFVGTTTTFKVHTVNGSCESLSYRLITITVGQPSIVSVNSTNPSCYGSTDGTITINATGGNGGLQYSINAGGVWQASNVFSNLAAGFYNVWVKDANGCTVVYSGNSVVLTQPQPVSVFINKVDALCNGSSTGRIDVFAGGGSGSYSYSKDNGATYQPTSVFSNLPAGSYNIVVKDGNNCTYAFPANPVVIGQPTAVTATATVVDAACAGTPNGNITVNASGGTSPYSYSLNNGPLFSNPVFTGLLAGNYNIIVVDVNGCQGTTSATVNNSYTFTVSVQSQTDVSCSGGADGSVTLTQTGGVPPYQYSIDGGTTWQNSPTFTGLSGGVYNGLVRDFNTCQNNVTITIIEKPKLMVNVVSVTNVGCYGDSTGAITVAATGGDGTYNYSWSNSATGATASNLPAGNYSVTVTDGAGCSASTAQSITSNPQLILQLEKNISVLCHGLSTGGIDVTVVGGTPAYTYLWSNGFTTEDLLGVQAGVYGLVATDAAGCTVQATYQITQPGSQLGATLTPVNTSCYGGNDGSVTAAGVGGTAPYTYLWSDANIGATDSLLAAGLYVVTVTDSNSCQYVKAATVGQPAPIVVTETVTPANCNGSPDGGITLTVTGGTPGYTYGWSNGPTTPGLTGVIAGVYTVTVTDTKNCTSVKAITVTEPQAILSSVSGNDPDCNGNATGFAVVSTSGGSAPYSYTWSTTPVQSGVMGVHLSGSITYFVTITDGHGCTHIDQVTLTEPSAVTVNTLPGNVKCFQGNDGRVEIQATGGSGNYEYFLNGIYQTSPIFTGLVAGTYTAVAQDDHNCIGSANFTITEPQAFVVDAGPDQVSVRGQTVQLSGNASSAHGILSYTWTPDFHLSCTACQVTQATPDTTTRYVLIAMDGDSCLGYDSLLVVVKNAVQYFIPTAFTPNADKLNDYFEFDILGANSIETSVFNRWGERVYFNEAQHNGIINSDAWDGTNKDGKKLPSDTYVYQLRVKFFDNSEENLSGTVTLMR